MPTSQNTALFSLLGTNYGGDGETTFGLPDLTGRVPMGWGTGVDLSARLLGESGGAEITTLLASEMPSHTHALNAADEQGDLSAPSPAATLARSSGATAYGAAASFTQLSPVALATTGGGQPHNNLQPYLTLTFIIALQGVFPQRT
jgi:microcystin-dependent protein